MPQDNPPPTSVRLQGASNFRDLGGLRGHAGRPVRRGRLFRSDHLAALTPQDHATLRDLGLARALDFRGRDERAAAPYQVPGVQQHSLAIEPSVAQRMQALVTSGHALTAPVMTGLMKELYRVLVNDRADRFAELFAHLLEADVPTVFHCTAGKDRTGVAAALLLLALGVSREQVMHDFLLTNQFYQYLPAPHPELPPDVVAVLWRVQAGFLDEALAVIDADHGGIDRYLRQRLGLGDAARQQLASQYLQA